MSSTRPRVRIPSLLDKILTIPLFARVIVAAAYRALTLPFTTTPKANTTFKDIIFAALRTQLSNISIAQEQWLSAQKSTEKTYLDFAKSANFQPDTDVLEYGLKLHWLGPKSAKKTVLYFHGGGYALACSPGHVKWLFQLQKDLSRSKSVSVVLVGYTLTPKGQFPCQLQQAAESLKWLLEGQGKKAGDIIIAGDSAGGNLTMGLLSHVLHPHPEVPKIELKEPLATTIMISPWVKFTTLDDSWRRNATSDMLSPGAAARWTELFLGSKPADEYSEPIRANQEWFAGIDRVTKDVLVWGGESEVLVDSIRKIGETLKSAHPKTEVVIQKGAAHEDFVLDVLLGYNAKGEGTKVIESWVAKRL